MTRLDPLAPRRTADGRLEGVVLHVDRFGNCISSIRHEHLTERMRTAGLRVRAGDREIDALRRFFAEEGADPGEPFVLWGSAGFLEIAVDRGSAAERLGLRDGSPVTVAPAGG